MSCPTCGSTNPTICRAAGSETRHGHPIKWRPLSVAHGGLPAVESKLCCRDSFHPTDEQLAEQALRSGEDHL